MPIQKRRLEVSPEPMPSHIASRVPRKSLDALQPMPAHSQINPEDWDKREDGSQKGKGFLGLLSRPDGSVSSEISMSTDDFGGKEFPTIVPTLSQPELDFLLNMNVGRDAVPLSIRRKAVDFAKQRESQGKPLFAQPGEEDYSVHPQYQRVE